MGEVMIKLSKLTVNEANDIEIDIDKDTLHIHNVPAFEFDSIRAQLPEVEHKKYPITEWIEFRNVNVAIFKSPFDYEDC